MVHRKTKKRAEIKNKAMKYRLYPNADQKKWLICSFGDCRFLWNQMLEDVKRAYQKNGDSISPLPAQYKEKFPFLKDTDSLALCNVQMDLSVAFTSFFNGKSSYPEFKAKHHSRASYTTNRKGGNILVGKDFIRLPKVGKIKAVIHRTPNAEWNLKSATVSMDHCGRFFCSCMYEFENFTKSVDVSSDRILGLDYKSDGLYVSSDGERAEMPHYYRLSEKRLSRAQRRLNRKKNGSARYEKQRLAVAKLSAHVTDQRRDYLHKKSRVLADKYDLIVVEDINLRGMARSLKLGKSTNDNGFGMFRVFLKYKLEEQGKRFIKIDKFYPSSQVCHECGFQNPITKDLSVRNVTCPACGAMYDRDANAALNIRDEGYRIYKSLLAS
jgi:putative transposase